MDRDQIVGAVEGALSDFPIESLAEQVLTAGRPDEPVGGIADVLGVQPEFNDPGRMLRTYMGAGRFSANEAARFLLRVARRVGADAALNQLSDLLSLKSAKGRVYAALWGIQVGSPIQILPDVRLVPFDDVPDRPQKHRLLTLSFGPHSGPWMPPEAALVSPVEINPLFYSGDAPEFDFGLGERTSEVALCMTAIGPSTPLVAARWFCFDDEYVEEATPFVGSLMSFGGHEILPRDVSPVPMDKSIVELVEQYFSAGDELRSRVRRSLERLRQSLVRREVGDRALDLAIALESLLVNERSGEYRYRTSLRAALLVSRRRRRSRSIVQAVYDLRGGVAHSGKAEATIRVSGSGQLPSDQVVTEAARICAEVIRELLTRGQIPDWSRLELGPDSG